MKNKELYRVHAEDCAHWEREEWCTCGKHVKLAFCCDFPNPFMWIDQNFGMRTAVVHCSGCQKIMGEIGIVEREE